MSWPDLVNGTFEALGGILILLSVFKLYHDKVVKGAHWAPPAFFTAWGLWNLFYYPALGQWASFTGGAFLVVVNAVWVAQMFYYGGAPWAPRKT